MRRFLILIAFVMLGILPANRPAFAQGMFPSQSHACNVHTAAVHEMLDERKGEDIHAHMAIPEDTGSGCTHSPTSH